MPYSQHLSTHIVRTFVFTVVGLGWLSTALAATAAVPDLIGLPWLQIALGSLLTLWGGLTRTAQNLVGALQADPPRPFRLGLELTKDLVTAGFIGFITFSFGAWSGFGEWQMAITLCVAGYAGAVFLNKFVDGWLNKFLPPPSPPTEPAQG